MVKRWSGLVLMIGLVGLAAACSKDKDKGKGGGGGGGSYANAAKVTEARLMLNKLRKGLSVSAITNGTLPSGTSPLTPSKPCCSYPDQQCPPDPAAWQQGLWLTVEFQIDEPHRFQYDITSDGTTFTAHAVGDMSCDGNVVTLTLRGKLDPETGVKAEIEDPTDKPAR